VDKAPHTQGVITLQVLFLDLMVARLLAMDTAQVRVDKRNLTMAEADRAARPTVKVLIAILNSDGHFVRDGTETKSEDCTRLRLAAARGLLDLCARPGLCAFIYSDWNRWLTLAFMMQDSCVEVRSQVRLLSQDTFCVRRLWFQLVHC
jgi:hypothetical protein